MRWRRQRRERNVSERAQTRSDLLRSLFFLLTHLLQEAEDGLTAKKMKANAAPPAEERPVEERRSLRARGANKSRAAPMSPLSNAAKEAQAKETAKKNKRK